MNVGIVDSAQIAEEMARSIWENYYTDYEYNKDYSVRIFYDEREGCWYLYSELPPDTLGSAPHIIFRSNGDILAVWHDGVVLAR